ncbi:MAG: hypothetical protein PF439_05010 [Helicobacteraceae bacterium]|jgi:hypothetical protein|nr:hypothetical protein [Helicobacteraceae bacterium]
MMLDPKKRNLYLTSIIIVLGLLFMFVTGYYILNGVEHGSSKDMAIDQRIDQCYEEKGLD